MDNTLELSFSKSRDIKRKLLQVIIQELRSPMSAIIGFIDLLKEDPVGEESSSMFETISRASAKSKELLDIARMISDIEPEKIAAKMRPYPIGKLIDYAIKDNAQLILAKNISCAHPIETETSELVIEPNSIKEILRILLSCLLAQTSEHGTINIEISEKSDKIELSILMLEKAFTDEDVLRIQNFIRSVDMLANNAWPDLRLVAMQFILLLHQASLWVSNTKEGYSLIKIIFPINTSKSEALHKILSRLN